MSSLSRTAAKRQAHRESHLHSRIVPTEALRGGYLGARLWDVVAGGRVLLLGASYLRARRELAAWRAERVRELMGGRSPHAHPPSFEANCPVCAAQARGDSTSRGEKGGSSR